MALDLISQSSLLPSSRLLGSFVIWILFPFLRCWYHFSCLSQSPPLAKKQGGMYMNSKSIIKHGLLSASGHTAGVEDTVMEQLTIKAKVRAS